MESFDKEDEGYAKQEVTHNPITQLIFNIAAFAGFVVNGWWLSSLLEVKATKVETDQIGKYQIVNAISFGICIVLNFTAKKWMKTDLQDIVKIWNVPVTPSGVTFAIWGIIYLFLTGFAVYQALPASWATSRNNDLIFGQIGWLFAININCNSLWLIVYQFSNVEAFLVDIWVILVMDVSGYAIL